MTQEFLNVLYVGLAINGILVITLIIIPAVRGFARRRSGRHAAAVAASGIRRPGVDSVEAGRPWFPDAAAGHSANGRAHDPGAAIPATRELATVESWRSWLAEESSRTARYHRPSTIVVVELSGLDRLAGRVGEAAASRLLPPVADTLGRHARAADRLARLDPARFGVLLVETDEVQAINYVERIRSGCDLWLAAGAVALRLSIGWAEIRADRPGEAALHEAERRLYAERHRLEPGEAADASDGRDGRAAAFQTSGA